MPRLVPFNVSAEWMSPKGQPRNPLWWRSTSKQKNFTSVFERREQTHHSPEILKCIHMGQQLLPSLDTTLFQLRTTTLSVSKRAITFIVLLYCTILVLQISVKCIQYFISHDLLFTGELQLRMAGDSRVLMDHNMEIGVTPAQVQYTPSYTWECVGLGPHFGKAAEERYLDI